MSEENEAETRMSRRHNVYAQRTGRHPDKVLLTPMDAQELGLSPGDQFHHAEVISTGATESIFL